jgi:hypothetical protein
MICPSVSNVNDSDDTGSRYGKFITPKAGVSCEKNRIVFAGAAFIIC